MTKVAVIGATGYSGAELTSILVRHPEVELAALFSSSGGVRTQVLPSDPDLMAEPFTFDALVESGAEVVFLATPNEVSAELVPQILDRGMKVIDLSGAFRLRDEATRARWYPETHRLPAGVAYGLTERERAAVAAARLVANPGCYPTSALLAIAPLLEAGLLVAGADIIVDAKSGVSGAGKTPSERTHFCEVHGSFSAYGVFNHRHGAEIEQGLGREVTFTPHLIPIDRGILSTIYVRVPSGTTEADVRAVFEGAYANAPFVRLRGGDLPVIKHVAHTNFCDIGWKLDEPTGRLIVVSCLDNLLKGAAGQAVQNFNIAFGFDERTGLL